MLRHPSAPPLLAALCLSLSGCDPLAGGNDEGTASPSATPIIAATAPTAVQPLYPPSEDASPSTAGDPPQAVLNDYARALHDRDWRAAAALWTPDSGVTAAALAGRFGRAGAVDLTFGPGVTEGAAGSLYHEVRYRLHRSRGPDETGSIIVRRVNDVPGAQPGELRWHFRAMIPDQPGHSGSVPLAR